MSDNTSETQWYVARDGQQHGPLSEAEMQLFVKGGHLKPTDLIWCAGFSDWRPAPLVFPPLSDVMPSAPATPNDTTAPKTSPAHDTSSTTTSPTTTSNPSTQQQPDQRSPTAHAMRPSGIQNQDRTNPAHQKRAMSPAQMSPGTAMAPTGSEPGNTEYATKPERGSVGRAAATLAVLAAIGTGGWFGYQNREAVADFTSNMISAVSTTNPSTKPPLVKADDAIKTQPAKPATDTAALKPSTHDGAPQPPATQTPIVVPIEKDPLAAQIDAEFQKSVLWSILKAEFPDWYTARIRQVVDLNAAGNDPEVSKKLLTEIVALRRKHANVALAASTDKLRKIAETFLANLKSLADHSTDTCYTFISKGELSPAVLQLMPEENFGNALEAQATAVFEAIADGRKTGAKRDRASKQDYDTLAKKLTSMGWTPQDLKLFANPTALAKAPPARVCKMVQDWFTAHIEMTDTGVQERLLFETLRPVIAG